MYRQRRYFLFNKKSDFTRGSGENIAYLEPGITLLDPGLGEGTFFSRLLDSREKAMAWHRILIERETISSAAVRVTLYVSEQPTLVFEGKVQEIGQVLSNEHLSMAQREAILKPFEVMTFDDPEDALLFDGVGRYLWFRIKLYAQENHSPIVRKVKLYFPKHTWLDYLPEIYQKEPQSQAFVSRFLGLFQSIYEDMEDQIRHFAYCLDPESVEDEFLRWLSEWIAVEDPYVWNEAKLRYLVSHGMTLYRIRGTAAYLEAMIQLYTDKKPFIVEQQHIRPFFQGGQGELLRTLYGEQPEAFTVIVDSEEGISTKEYKILTRIVEHAKPAHMDCHMVVLEPYLFLDRYAYLGINSTLGKYQDFVLDGRVAIPFTTLS